MNDEIKKLTDEEVESVSGGLLNNFSRRNEKTDEKTVAPFVHTNTKASPFEK